MGATDFHDVFPVIRFFVHGVAKRLNSGDEPAGRVDRGGDVHGGGKRVVGRLSHVDVVVRVHGGLAAQGCSSELTAAVGDDFVDVHVELGAAASHPYVQWKHVVMLSSQDFVAGFDDQVVLLRTKTPTGVVHIGSRFFERRVGGDHLPWNQILANAEMLERSLGLRAPKLVGRHFDNA